MAATAGGGAARAPAPTALLGRCGTGHGRRLGAAVTRLTACTLRVQALGQLLGRLGLGLAPEGDVLGDLGGAAGAQFQEIERGPEARMREQAEHALAHALVEARLQQPDLLHRQGKPPRQRDALGLVKGDAVGRALLGHQRVGAGFLHHRQLAAVGRPQQGREQEGRRHRLVLGDALVGVAKGLQQHGAQRTAAVGFQRQRRFREQRRQQAVVLERQEAALGMAGEEHLQALVEQAGGRRRGQQVRQLRHRGGRFGRHGEAELGCEPRRAQHAHRVFAVALHGIADQAQHPVLAVLVAAHVVAHRKVLDGVVERVGGEVAPHRVILDGAVDVVAQQAAAVFGFAVAAAVVHIGAEGGHLDDLAAIDHVRQPEAPADQPAVAEQRLHLLGRGVGGHVEILGVAADQQVAHRATHQVALETAFAQPVEHAQGVGADVLAGYAVLGARDGQELVGDGDARIQGLGAKARGRRSAGGGALASRCR
jgi:hypothetical protein